MRRQAAAALCLLLLAPVMAQAFNPALPTDNDALFRAHPERFYMFTDRNFEGVKSTPWQGGTYGFSRGPERIGSKVIRTKFHEGIDIAPMRRDASGEPLDDVRAVESGRVIHTSINARDSNYGKYVVIHHDVEGAPIFTIYAHMSEIAVSPGQDVAKGTRLGRVGHTGEGLDRRRAHLHLEIAVLWHDQFGQWHSANFSMPNKHGIYNGLNMMGLDSAAFYLAQRKNPALTLPQFIRSQQPAFRVQIPASPHFQLPHRYPWLIQGDAASVRSWIVSFTAAGFPISIEPSDKDIPAPHAIWAAPSAFPLKKITRSLITGTPDNPRLAEGGEKLMSLLTWNPPATP